MQCHEHAVSGGIHHRSAHASETIAHHSPRATRRPPTADRRPPTADRRPPIVAEVSRETRRRADRWCSQQPGWASSPAREAKGWVHHGFMQARHHLTPVFHVQHDAPLYLGCLLTRSVAGNPGSTTATTPPSPHGVSEDMIVSLEAGLHSTLVSRETCKSGGRNHLVPRPQGDPTSILVSCNAQVLAAHTPRHFQKRTPVGTAGRDGRPWPGIVRHDETRSAPSLW